MWVKVFQFQTISQSWQWPDVLWTLWFKFTFVTNSQRAQSLFCWTRCQGKYTVFTFIYIYLPMHFPSLFTLDLFDCRFCQISFGWNDVLPGIGCCRLRSVLWQAGNGVLEPLLDLHNFFSAKTKQTAHANKQCCRRMFIPCDFFTMWNSCYLPLVVQCVFS